MKYLSYHWNFLGISYFHGHYFYNYRHYNHAGFTMAAGATEDAWNSVIDDLEEILATELNITRMNAAGVISIFKLVVNDRENYKLSHLLSL